jgi:predicted RND superfamily exporter protein
MAFVTQAKRLVARLIPVFVCLSATTFIAVAFAHAVDLTPHVDEAFFFSKHDPQLKTDHAIDALFPESPQLVIAVEGDLHSPEYLARVRVLSDALASQPGVRSVQSLARGPKNLDDALKSPLWSRLLIPEDHKSSYVFVTFERAPDEAVVQGIEALQAGFDRPDFHLAIAGVPYVNDQIGRNLARDMRIFSLAAVGLFGVVLLVIFRSPWILLGTFVACADSSALTLLAIHWIHIPIGPLTANLSTMVFVMTLSPIVFLTFNWKGVRAEEEGLVDRRPAMRAAVARTVVPSFWSGVCMILGFVSLLLVPSTPMRHLGIAGAIGAALAFSCAYGVYPWFLEQVATGRRARPAAHRTDDRLRRFFGRRHGPLVAGLFVLTLVAAYGLRYLDTDPTLPSYFKAGGDLRAGLEFVDHAGGSSPLKIVVADPHRAPLNTGDAYQRLWTLQHALERDPAVGTVVSLPLVLGEAKRRWFSFLISDEHWIKILDSPKRGEISRGLITANRTETLFLLRMKETDRTTPRQVVIDRLTHIVEQTGFRPVLVGGTYGLLDQQAELVRSSVISGVLLLIGIFVAMGYAFSRSFRVAGAMLVSLAIIPVVVRGAIAYLGMPLDFVTASAANLDLGLGVDAMIYLTLAARAERHTRDDEGDPWTAWSHACSRLWQPIGTSLVVITCGFGIFLLSNFPPTQRFGAFVIFGSAAAASTALVVFPWLASLRFRSLAGSSPSRNRDGRSVDRGPAHTD